MLNSELPTQGAQVGSLIGELRSYMPHSATPIPRKNECQIVGLIVREESSFKIHKQTLRVRLFK